MGYVGILGEAITSDEIRALIMNGQGYRVTTGRIATGAGGTIVGLEIICNAIAKNVFFYRGNISANGVAGVGTLVADNSITQDAALTTNLLTSIANQKIGGPASAVTAAWATPGASTATATVGTASLSIEVPAHGPGIEMFVYSGGVYIPAGQAGRCILYFQVNTAANAGEDCLEWVEF